MYFMVLGFVWPTLRESCENSAFVGDGGSTGSKRDLAMAAALPGLLDL
jgi:hypothetical protein